jgi:hypothetical protein
VLPQGSPVVINGGGFDLSNGAAVDGFVRLYRLQSAGHVP